MKEHNLIEKAYQHYQDGGIGAVCDFANKENINEWSFCAPCDCETPVSEDTCLACGQTLKIELKP